MCSSITDSNWLRRIELHLDSAPGCLPANKVYAWGRRIKPPRLVCWRLLVKVPTGADRIAYVFDAEGLAMNTSIA